MPIGRINQIMTSGNKVKDIELGDSGETYLVGSISKARSMSRFLLEDKQGYLDLMKDTGIVQNTISQMDLKESNIGLESIKTQGSKAAISGKTGYEIFPDYRNVNVLSAYTPLKIHGLNWVLMSEINEEEAFRAEYALSEKLLTFSIVLFIIIASAAEEQSATAVEMNKNIINISQVSDQTANGSEQTTAAAKELVSLK